VGIALVKDPDGKRKGFRGQKKVVFNPPGVSDRGMSVEKRWTLFMGGANQGLRTGEAGEGVTR